MIGADDFFLLLLLVIFMAIIGIIGWVIVEVKTSKSHIKLAEAEVDKRKLELIMKRAMIEDLKNASVMLSDHERAQLDAINTDTSILSRKVLYTMNEVEDRTKRLELGSNLGKMNFTLGKIKKYEQRLFGPELYQKRRRVVRR